jgi:hypothetical protein
MAVKSRWSTIEGGIANTFPLSINRNTHWTALRRGECYVQDMADWERRGVLRYIPKPVKSPQNVTKEFKEFEFNPLTDIVEFYAYGRYWKVNLEDPRELLFSEIYVGGEVEYDPDAAILFNDDGDDPIRLVAPDGNGRIYVIKRSSGYVLSEANADITTWRKSAPDYSIGTLHGGPSYTNSIYNGSILVCWDALEEGAVRHFFWNGNETVELSEDIRELADLQKDVQLGEINWAKNLAIFGPFVYDVRAKRVFYYSGSTKANFVSRAYYEANYRPITIYRMAFLTDGKVGSFKATIEYGQADDNLQKTKSFVVNITPQSRTRVRHIWNLDLPVKSRIWRLRIEDLTGCAISQIDVDAATETSPDVDDGTQ